MRHDFDDTVTDVTAVSASHSRRSRWTWVGYFGGEDPTDTEPRTEHVVRDPAWEENMKLMKEGSDAAFDAEDVDGNSSASGNEKGTLLQSSMQLANVCLGAGALCMPFAFKHVGLALGFTLLLLTYLVMTSSAVVLCEAARKMSPSATSITYGGIMHQCFGSRGSGAVQWIIVFSTLGAGIVHLQLIGDLVSPPVAYFMGDDPAAYCSPWSSRLTMIAFAAGFECLFCFAPPTIILRSLAYLTVLCIVFLTVVAAVRNDSVALDPSPVDGDRFNAVFRVFRSVSILIFAFSPHIHVVQTFRQLEDPTPARVISVVWLSSSACLVLYGVIGYFGYLTFYDTSGGNTLLNHRANDTAVTVARFSVAACLFLKFPTVCEPCALSVDRFFFPFRSASTARRLLWIGLFVALCFSAAALVSDISIVLSLTGVLGLTPACLLVPAAVFLKQNHKLAGYLHGWRNKLAWVAVCLSGVIMLVALVANVAYIVDPDKGIACQWARNCDAQRCCPPGHEYLPDFPEGQCPY
ncbi:Vacuolar amino acid transporter 2 [Diplonema papillatum]|nr:Vacuolar amino acid transporter 2 [Diplonema papillatum]